MKSRSFLIVYRFLLQSTVLSNTAKLLLCLLQDHCNKQTGQCNPRIQTLAGELGVSRSTIDRGLRRLRELGLIQILWGQRASRYQIAPPGEWSEILKRCPANPDASPRGNQKRQSDASEGGASLYEPDLTEPKRARAKKARGLGSAPAPPRASALKDQKPTQPPSQGKPVVREEEIAARLPEYPTTASEQFIWRQNRYFQILNEQLAKRRLGKVS